MLNITRYDHDIEQAIYFHLALNQIKYEIKIILSQDWGKKNIYNIYIYKIKLNEIKYRSRSLL